MTDKKMRRIILSISIVYLLMTPQVVSGEIEGTEVERVEYEGYIQPEAVDSRLHYTTMVTDDMVHIIYSRLENGSSVMTKIKDGKVLNSSDITGLIGNDSNVFAMDYLIQEGILKYALVVVMSNGTSGIYLLNQEMTSIELFNDEIDYGSLIYYKVFSVGEERLLLSPEQDVFQIINYDGENKMIDLSGKIPYREGEIRTAALSEDGNKIIAMTGATGQRVRGDENDMFYEIDIETEKIERDVEYQPERRVVYLKQVDNYYITLEFVSSLEVDVPTVVVKRWDLSDEWLTRAELHMTGFMLGIVMIGLLTGLKKKSVLFK